MDELDAAIALKLQSNGRLSNRELAAELGIAPSTCLLRTRLLRERGVITGFRAQLDLDAIGLHVQALLAVQIRPLSRAVIESFKRFALDQPEVLAIFTLAGGDDFLVHVAVPDLAAMHAVLLDKFSKRKEVVGFRTSVIYDHQQRPLTEFPDLDTF